MAGAVFALIIALVGIGFVIWKGMEDKKERRKFERERERIEERAANEQKPSPPRPAEVPPPQPVGQVEMGVEPVPVVVEAGGRRFTAMLTFCLLNRTWIKEGIPTASGPMALALVAQELATSILDKLEEAADHPDHLITRVLAQTALDNKTAAFLRRHDLSNCLEVALGPDIKPVNVPEELDAGVETLPVPEAMDLRKLRALALAQTEPHHVTPLPGAPVRLVVPPPDEDRGRTRAVAMVPIPKAPGKNNGNH